eukprot:SAG31_NODE_6751_length_1899_cov_1.296667_1_plen_85_part_00
MLQTCIVAPGIPVFPYFKSEEDKVDAADMAKVNSSMVLLLGSFAFMTLVLRISKWRLTPALGMIMVACYFAWAIQQVYADFKRD